ncbi:hypothetical protein LUZ60_001238 [Juncus effusus]|nr:hypothetical protein LUZ60_001238 [Juncus effusus]
MGRGSASVAVINIAVVLLVVCVCQTSVVDARRFIVGDDMHWTFGYNYTDWALKNAPFHTNDTLVFKYDPPSNTTHAHSVYLMRSLKSYTACNLKTAIMVANITQGGGSGFEFVLKKRKHHYFVCGERDGLHCTIGNMKFIVLPKKPCPGARITRQ